jgi:hypothetical protein
MPTSRYQSGQPPRTSFLEETGLAFLSSWQRVNLEFEFESRNFRDHGHPLTGCDVIVCWHHNWDDCPAHIEVLELSSFIKSLRRSQD